MKIIRKIIKCLGPGLITGASDDDPSGIATYSQTGAQYGYLQLWTALFTFPFMAVIQEMCGRIGLVTGKGLAHLLKAHYPNIIAYGSIFFLLFANIVNIGADLGAMASSLQLLLHLPFFIWLVIVAGITLGLQIFIPYTYYSRYLKYLAIILFVYVISAFSTKQDWGKVLYSTFIPYITFKKEYILNLVAILGTTISPYLFFWQVNEETEEEKEKHKIYDINYGKPRLDPTDIKHMRFDTFLGMFFSNFITFFIIITAAATLHIHNMGNIETADQAAKALKPIAGHFAFLLFTIGIICSGLLSIPVLVGSGAYALSEIYGWKEGLSKKFQHARAFYLIIAFSILIGIVINFLPIKPFTLLYYAAALNGVAAPFLLIMIMLIANNKKLMRNHTNSLLSNILGWLITGLMGVASIGLVISLFSK